MQPLPAWEIRIRLCRAVAMTRGGGWGGSILSAPHPSGGETWRLTADGEPARLLVAINRHTLKLLSVIWEGESEGNEGAISQAIDKALHR